MFSGRALAVSTPYNDTPAAVVGNGGGQIWDNELAADIAFDEAEFNVTPQIYFVADFCHSGGFVDDLANNTNTVYAATAAQWYETSTSAPTSPITFTIPFGPTITLPLYFQNSDVASFGQTFMNQAGGGATMGASFAAANAAVINNQTPVQYSSNAGILNTKLTYGAGDQAVIFSAGDPNSAFQQGNFQTDVQTAYTALRNQAFPAGNISTVWDQGQAIAANAPLLAVPAGSASTIGNLQSALTAAFGSGIQSNNKLVLYMNDHGVSTDQVLCKVTGNGNGTWRYSYQVTVANGRTGSPDTSSDYGVSTLKIGSGVPADAVQNAQTGAMPGTWAINVDANGDLVLASNSLNSAGSWLTPGVGYQFSYDSKYPPAKDNWITLYNYTTGTNQGGSDVGANDGTPWGTGAEVYDQDTPSHTIVQNGVTYYYYNDPSQVAGWDNGGDGWAEAPTVPEPASAAVLLLAAPLLLRRRGREGGHEEIWVG
jgi:hypothetical protein